MDAVGKIPLPALDNLRKGVKSLKKFEEKFVTIQGVLEFFAYVDWIFRNDRIYSVINRLSDEEKKEFSSDVGEVDWPSYL